MPDKGTVPRWVWACAGLLPVEWLIASRLLHLRAEPTLGIVPMTLVPLVWTIAAARQVAPVPSSRRRSLVTVLLLVGAIGLVLSGALLSSAPVAATAVVPITALVAVRARRGGVAPGGGS
jgi:hypothetical protein